MTDGGCMFRSRWEMAGVAVLLVAGIGSNIAAIMLAVWIVLHGC